MKADVGQVPPFPIPPRVSASLLKERAMGIADSPSRSMARDVYIDFVAYLDDRQLDGEIERIALELDLHAGRFEYLLAKRERRDPGRTVMLTPAAFAYMADLQATAQPGEAVS